MVPQVFAVRTGEKYGPHYEDYINSKIPNVTWIREEIIAPKQWNKLVPMSYDINEPIVVIDIDQMFVNDYMDAINYPIERGEFLSARSWWGDTHKKEYTIQGGFQKYYPKDVKYIYDEFVSRPEYWMNYYVENKTTIPGMGEQYFVEDMVRKNLTIKYLPSSWVTRWEHQMSHRLTLGLNLDYSLDWLYLGGKFHPQIRLVHFLDQESLDKEGLEVLIQSEPFSD